MSFNGGVTFGASQLISDSDSPVVLDPNLATCYHGDYDTQIQTPSAAVEVWSDDRGTEGGGNNPDVWTDTTAISNDFLVIPTPVSQTVCAGTNATVDLDVPSFNGFTDPVTLSVSGNPGGTTTGFSVNPVTPPGSSVLTVGNTGAVAAGSYPMTITGTAGAITHDGDSTLVVFAGIPGAVTLLSPANGAINQAVDVTLSWSSDPNDGLYTVEVATDPSFANIVDSASGLATPSYVPSGLATNTTYYWRVRPINACGTGANSAVFSFSTVAGPGDCATGSVPHQVYSYGFEAGASGWTHSGTQDTWNLTSNGAYVHSGTQAFHATDPASISDQRLVSPAVALPSGEDPVVLEFWNFQTMESFSGGCFDGGIVEVSTDGGTTWTQVAGGNLLSDPYDGTVSSSFSNPLAGLQAWCGDPQPFLNSIVDVTAYAGQTVQFRFRLGTDTSVSRTDGWNIDDVLVQSCQVDGSGLPFDDGFESGDTSAWSVAQP